MPMPASRTLVSHREWLQAARDVEDHTLRTPLIVMMSVVSPWSQQLVRTLADRFDIDVLDCNITAHERSALEEQSLTELRQFCRVHLLPPRLGPAHVIRGAMRLRSLHDVQLAPVLCLYGGLQAAIAWISGVRPYIVYVVGSDVLTAEGIRRRMLGPTLRGAATVFSNGSALAARTRALAPDADVRELYLGVDVARFRGPALPRPGARFVCTRAFRPIYDNETIVRALAALPDVPEAFSFTFLSSGPLLDQVQALARSLLSPSMRARVTFEGGVSDERLVATLRENAIYVSASLSDGASASLLEAMSAGLFPIVTDIPANREWITHRDNGLLFPPGDSRALAGAMAEAATWPAWVDDARGHNLALVSARADSGTNLQTLADSLVDLAAGSAP